MRRKTIRFINRHFGSSALKLFWALDKIKNALFYWRNYNTQERPECKNILAIKIVGLGDTILMLPALKWLKDSYNCSKLYVLATPLSAGLLKDQPCIDEIIIYDIFGKHKGLIGLVKIIFELRRKNIDIVIDYEQHIKLVTIASYLTGAKRRIGFNTPENRRDYLLTSSIPFDDCKHMVEAFNDLIVPLGFVGKTRRLEKVYTSNEDKQYVSQWLKEKGITQDDVVVGIHAGSGKTAISRRWPKERFAELADMLVRRISAQVILTGSPDEMDLLNNIAQLMTYRPIIAAGYFTIKQLAVLIERFDLLISNDTGPMHIGPAMGTTTIGLFGPQEPIRYKPFGDHHIALYKKMPCSPCINVHYGQVPQCKTPKCMELITVNDVWDAIESKISLPVCTHHL